MSAAHPDHAEGWEWVRIQRDPCPQCGHHPAGLPPGALGAGAVTSASAWRGYLQAAADADLRTCPAPSVWSPLQYGAHVRDMLAVFGNRILVAVTEDDPIVPSFDPGPAGWSAYNLLDAGELADELEAEAARFQSIVAGVDASAWSRTARRDGVDRFTVAGLACFGVHEAHHHLLDAERRW